MSEQPETDFVRWYRTTIDEQVGWGCWVREPFWSEALAVGSEEWVNSLLPNVGNARVECVDLADSVTEVAEASGTYAVYASKQDRRAFWQKTMQ